MLHRYNVFMSCIEWCVLFQSWPLELQYDYDIRSLESFEIMLYVPHMRYAPQQHNIMINKYEFWTAHTIACCYCYIQATETTSKLQSAITMEAPKQVTKQQHVLNIPLFRSIAKIGKTSFTGKLDERYTSQNKFSLFYLPL